MKHIKTLFLAMLLLSLLLCACVEKEPSQTTEAKVATQSGQSQQSDETGNPVQPSQTQSVDVTEITGLDVMDTFTVVVSENAGVAIGGN